MPGDDQAHPSLSPAESRVPDGAYARKLGLAILSVLQDKGVLSAADVDTILLAVNRSLQGDVERQPAQDPERQVPQIDMEL